MKDYLFIYGTLMPEHAPDEIADAVRRLCYVGPACVRGRLYDLGQYPGAIIDASSHMKVYGQLFMLPDDLSTLRALDAYEGFEPEDTHNSLFVRERAAAMLEDGQVIQCWVYVYNRDPGSAPLIPGGDYAKSQAV
ncbi:MAG: gamma-glutamylcyclotransferase [Acidobacteria bacterium]|nr:gamma-glutamylcyclotransferase [Acidobacteriota bacterium]